MSQLFTNNATSTLAAGIAAGATSLTVATGDGAKFPTLSGSNYFLATLFQYSGGTEANHEIVKVTARAGDVFTVTRAQEGTSARTFNLGDPIQLRVTAASVATPLITGPLGINVTSATKNLEVGGEARVQKAGTPATHLYDTSGTVDSRKWKTYITATGALRMALINDAESAETTGVSMRTNKIFGIHAETTEAWTSTLGLRVGDKSSLVEVTGNLYLSYNAYYDGSWKFLATGSSAFQLYQVGSALQFHASTGVGTAGAVITWGDAVTLGANGALVVAGGQVSFPATQKASADANTLDDYEEGTWTPADNSGAGLSFTVSTATYVKIGRMVHFQCHITWPSSANGAQANIGGLPFSPYGYNAVPVFAGGGYVYVGQIASSSIQIYGPGAAAITNSQMSSQFCIISGSFQVA